ncbi:hypothetical protein ACOME3_005570 [Neoechinorhynchus agilis]
MRWRLILPNKRYFDPIPTQTVVTGIIPDKFRHQLSPLVKFLDSRPDLPKFKHLKRVRRIENGFESENYFFLRQPLNVIRPSYFECFKEAVVPVRQCLLQSQADQSPWPISFHPDVYLEKLLRDGITNDWPQSDHDAVIIDPSSGQVLASANHRPSELLGHPVLILINEFSKSIGYGWWGIGSIRDLINGITMANHQINEKPISQRYMCTGLDVFLKKEPCPMCAMALVHSRVRRVFFKEKNPMCGAFGSKLCVHWDPRLNHKIECFHLEKNNH